MNKVHCTYILVHVHAYITLTRNDFHHYDSNKNLKYLDSDCKKYKSGDI